MFVSFFVVLGLFLLLAVKRPSAHRSLIAFAAWWSLFHATVMAIQTVQAWDRGIHRDYRDVVIAGIIGSCTAGGHANDARNAENQTHCRPTVWKAQRSGMIMSTVGRFSNSPQV